MKIKFQLKNIIETNMEKNYTIYLFCINDIKM